MNEGSKIHTPRKVVKQMVQSNGNGNSDNPDIEVTFEHLDDETQQVQDFWMRGENKTGRRELSVGDEVREELGIEEDDESESD